MDPTTAIFLFTPVTAMLGSLLGVWFVRKYM